MEMIEQIVAALIGGVVASAGSPFMAVIAAPLRSPQCRDRINAAACGFTL